MGQRVGRRRPPRRRPHRTSTAEAGRRLGRSALHPDRAGGRLSDGAGMTGPWVNRVGLSARLFAAMGLVVVAGAGTLLVVAILVAPKLFHTHLQIALGTIPAATQRHVDEAFTSAILLSLGIAVLVAMIAALSVTWLVTRRIATPVADLAAAAQNLASGNTDTRVPDPGLGPEFAALVAGFNTTAVRLAQTERVRQRMLADLAHELRTP